MAERRKAQRYPLIEWVSAAIGLVIAGAMFGLLAVEVARHRDEVPPLMAVEPVALTFAQGQYVLEVEVSNASGTTGASVAIEGRLSQGRAEIETSSATLAYVPGESARTAGLVFAHDPRKYRLELRVTGYERP